MKNKTYVFINIIGLGLAIACCIVAFLNWEYNTKFDSYHSEADHVYRINFVRITNGRPIKNGSCPLPLGAQIDGTIAQVDKVIRFFPVQGNFKVNNELFRTSISAVDPGFFDVFTFPLSAGNIESFQGKQAILISQELSQKHFPEVANPIGNTLTYINNEKRIEYQVAGVFEKPPKNTSFRSDAFVPYDNIVEMLDVKEDNWKYFNTTYVQVNNPNDIAVVKDQLQAYVAIQNKEKEDYKVESFYLDPFVGMSVRSEREDVWNHWTNNSLPTAAAIAPGIMAVLILLLACFNFTNTSIAIANRRIKEIGMRKVLGANRRQLILQFMGENTMLVFLALMVGIITSIFLVPAYSAMWPFLEIKFNLLENLDLLGFLVLLLITTALLAGSYPSLYVSSFRPTTILKGKTKFSGTNILNRVLLTAQFAIALLAIIAGFIFAQNATYQEEYDMGFDMESVVFAYVNDEQGFNKLENELKGYSKITEIAGSRHSISNSWYTDPIKHGESQLDVSIFDVGAGYLSTIGATIVEGRDFIENSKTDAEQSVIINQELAKTMGWENPIDKRIVLRDTIMLNVVGVVKDIYYEGGLWDPLEPSILRYALPENYRFLTAKANVTDLVEVKALMDQKWKTVFPDELSTVQFLDGEKADMANVNKNIKTMFIFLGILAVFLSVIGMFSLVSLNLIKRMKEIGVRKVLGATVEHITFKVSREFIIILTVASVLGSLGGFYLTKSLMASIWTYYVPIQFMPILISVCLLFLVSGITIGGKVLKAVSVNPAHILRDE